MANEVNRTINIFSFKYTLKAGMDSPEQKSLSSIIMEIAMSSPGINWLEVSSDSHQQISYEKK